MSLSVAVLIVVASLTVYVGSKLSAGNSLIPLEPQELEGTEMTMAQALIIPVTASACLLILFFFFAYVQYILVGMLVLVGTGALFQLLYITIMRLFAKLDDQLVLAISLCTTVAGVIYWISTGNVIMHNLLGCALCTVFISTLRFPSLKIACLCLTLLVAYDIFWVFCSEYFFEKNVMVDVATKVASNPIYDAGKHMHIDLSAYVSQTIELPIKLMIPNLATGRMVMLGLGDIALPGALVAFSLRCDLDINREKEAHELIPDAEQGIKTVSAVPTAPGEKANALFTATMTGYVLGLVAAFVGNTLSGVPQPALIYLVPGVLLPMVWRAWQLGQLKNVWHGPRKDDSSV